MSKKNQSFLKNLQVEHEHSGQHAVNSTQPTKILLGIDYGEKHTGLAICENGVILPLQILNTDSLILNTLAEICKKRRIKQVIWGLPIGINSEENHICAQIRKQADKLKQKTRIPYKFVNERYSTQMAHSQKLKANDERIDDLAAMRILEFYLNSVSS